MRPLESNCGDEPILALLVACDQALAAGGADDGPAGAEVAPELRERAWKVTSRVFNCCASSCRAARRSVPRPLPPMRPWSSWDTSRSAESWAGATLAWSFWRMTPKLRREVALKIPRPEALPTAELRHRFLREARAAAGLDHPNLVPVFEVHADGPICYIASAYCPGITLAAWLKESQWARARARGGATGRHPGRGGSACARSRSDTPRP